MNESNVSLNTQEAGPFVVSGPTVLRSMSPVMSEKGEPMTWKPGDGEVLDDGAALCRCGQSANKPFCDGSHTDADWDPSSGFPAASYRYEDDATRVGEGEQEILDSKMLCMHAGFCGTARTSVWEMVEETSDTETRAMAMRMVEKCPSGRLTNVVQGSPVEQPLPVEIAVVPDGPLWATGGVRVVDADGTELEVRNRQTLCRCGASSLKPLCDGSHKDVGFQHDPNGE